MVRPAIFSNQYFQLAMLVLIAAGAVYNRSTLGPLQESLKLSLHLEDRQIALLQGPALSWPMVIIGVPLGYLCSRTQRTLLLVALAIAGGCACCVSALAPNFVVLMGARCLVGASAFSTAAVVVITMADLFSPNARGRAMMILTLGMIVGSGVALALSGFLMKVAASAAPNVMPWRWSLGLLALPLVIPVVASLMLIEPPRRESSIARPTVKQALGEVMRMRALVLALVFGVIIEQVTVGASGVWAPSVLARTYGADPFEIGLILSSIGLGCGVFGAVAGGTLADLSYDRGGPALSMLILGLLALSTVPASAFGFMPSLASAGAMMAVGGVLGTLITVLSTSVSLVVIPNELRGIVTGVLQSASLLVTGAAPLGVTSLIGRGVELPAALVWVGALSGVGGAIFFFGGAGKLYVARANATETRSR